jgi:hypothetical protein
VSAFGPVHGTWVHVVVAMETEILSIAGRGTCGHPPDGDSPSSYFCLARDDDACPSNGGDRRLEGCFARDDVEVISNLGSIAHDV